VAVERVTPAPGAQRVRFDYDAADAAITWATRTMPSTVGEQVAAYDPAVTAAQVDWEGRFRQEFDRAAQQLRDRLTTLSGMGDLTIADAAFRAADEANRRQRLYNQQQADAEEAAEAAAADPATPGGP